jgi:hypothetical protein
MNYFPRLLMVGAILFVVLGFYENRAHQSNIKDRDLQSKEFSCIQAGLTTVITNDPPVPEESNNLPGHPGISGNPATDLEDCFCSSMHHTFARIHLEFEDYRPGLLLRTGQFLHRDVPGKDPSMG